MPHGHFMRGTRLDHLLALGSLVVVIVVIVVAVNPIRALSVARDEQRSDDVRKIMTSVLTLSETEPATYQALLIRLQGGGEKKYLLGTGNSCAGNWGRYCADEDVADDCLPPEEIFEKPEDAPSDPARSLFGLFGTGYYLAIHDDMLTVGACGADTGIIQLETFVP